MINGLLFAADVGEVTLWSKLVAPEGRAILGWVLGVVALWLIGPNATTRKKAVGAFFGILGLGVFWSFVPTFASLPVQSVFFLLTGITIFSAVATISSRSPVYSAIWFAVSLLGTAGLFLFQGAQFLGIATIAVYAGAIVVTFLFVLMLAQPEGHAFFDRVSWGKSPRFMIPMATMTFVSIIAYQIGAGDNSSLFTVERVIDNALVEVVADQEASVRSIQRIQDGDISVFRIDVTAEESLRPVIKASREAFQEAIGERIPGWSQCIVEFQFGTDVQAPEHVANLGAQLFGKHLVAVEVAGCLLMMALVGSIAIGGLDDSHPRKSRATSS